jgi:hypothetical protein
MKQRLEKKLQTAREEGRIPFSEVTNTVSQASTISEVPSVTVNLPQVGSPNFSRAPNAAFDVLWVELQRALLPANWCVHLTSSGVIQIYQMKYRPPEPPLAAYCLLIMVDLSWRMTYHGSIK